MKARKVDLMWLFLPHINNIFVKFFVNVYLIKELGQLSYGQLATAMTYFAIAKLFLDFGLKDYFLSRLKQGEEEIFFSRFYYIKRILIPIFVILSLIPIFYLPYQDTTKFLILILLLLDSIALSFIYSLNQFGSQLMNQLPYFSKMENIGIFSIGLIKLVFLFLFENLIFYLFMVSIFQLLIYYLLFRTNNFSYDLFKHRITLSNKEIFEFIVNQKKNIFYFFMYSLTYYIYFMSDQFIISLFLDETNVGLYNLSYMVITIGIIPLHVFWGYYLPKVSKLNGYDKSIFIRKWCYILFFLGFLTFIFAYSFIQNITLMIFDETYLVIVPIVQILSFYFLFRNLNVVLEMNYLVNGLEKFVTYSRLFATFFNLFFNIYFIPKYGLIAAAYTTVASEAIMTIIYLTRKVIYDSNAKVNTKY